MAGLMDLLFPYANDQERAAATKDKDMSAPARPAYQGYFPGDPRIMSQQSDYLTDPQYTDMPVEQRLQAIDQMPQTQMQQQLRRGQLEGNKDASMTPPDWNTMSLGDKAGMIVTGRGNQLWEAQDAAQQKAAIQEQQALQGSDPRSPDAYSNYAKPPAQPNVIDEPIPTPATPAQPVVDPQAQMIEQIKQQKAMLDQLYPQRSYENPTQSQADAYGLDARKRAAQLAQLAFFAGVTNSAGGNWTAIGQGLMNAGAAYDQGFQRYQSALQDSATRQQTQSDQKYTDEVNRTNSAVSLYENSQKLALMKEKERADQYKEQRKEIMERFKTEEPKLGDYPQPEDRATWEDWRKRYGASMESGNYIASLNDVRK